MTNVSLDDLIKAGAHYGHQSRRWNPKMSEYLYGVNKGVHIFDLIKTKAKFEEALEFIKKSSSEGKTFIFVGSKKQAKEKIKEVAEATNSYFVNERWLGGTLTNFEQLKKSTTKLSDMREKRAAGAYKNRTKKERLLLDREIERLERFFTGVMGITKTPDIMILADIKGERGAVREAKLVGAKTVGLVDSNCDPNEVNFPIPMNDDAVNALNYAFDLIKDAILEGKTGSKQHVEGSKVEKKAKK
jgi:small subunit ribosomal protein S2